jgi:predicted phage-related endonuclease
MVGKVTPDTMASASIVPAIMGHSPYQSPNDCLMRAIDATKGIPRPDLEDSEPANWGNLLETTILEQAALRIGLENLNLDHTEAYFHPLIKLACSLDGTADGNGLVVKHNPDAGIYVMDSDEIALNGIGVMEAKLTAIEPTDSPPLYQGPLQLQAQMDIIGAEWGAVCTLFKGSRLRVFLFKRHPATCQEIAKAVIDFQRRVDRYLVEGAIDYYPPKNTKDADRTWSEAEDKVVTLDNDITVQLIGQITFAKAEIKRMEEVVERAETNLKNMMRDATVGRCADWEVRWPMRHYKAQPERVVPAKEASSVRQSTLTIKERTA